MQEQATEEVLVKFGEKVSEDRAMLVLKHIRGVVLGRISSTNLYRVRIPEDVSVAEAIRILEGFDEVVYAEPNALERNPVPQ